MSIFSRMGSLLKRFTEQSIENLDRWIEIGSGYTPTSTGFMSPSMALSLPAVWACHDLITKALSIPPGHVYERLDGGMRERQIARNHYLYPLVHDMSNPSLPASEWKRIVGGHLLGWGNHYTWIEWDNSNRAKALWPIPPEAVKVERDSMTAPIRYYIRDGKSGQWVEFPEEDILHIRGFGYDGTRGYSPIGMLRETFGLAQASQQSASAMHRNGITSSVIIETDVSLDEEQKKSLKEQIQAGNAGARNAHRALVLSGGMKAKPFSINPNDAQFLEQQQYQDSKIYQIHGVAPHLVGDTEKSTSWGTGIEQQTIGFTTLTLLPILKNIETWLTHKLLSGPYFVEYDMKGLLRGDLKARAEWYKAMIEISAYSPNRVLISENEDPYEGGDVYRRPLNTAYVDSKGNVVSYTPPGAQGGPANDPAQVQ